MEDNFIHAIWIDRTNLNEIKDNFIRKAKQKNLKCSERNGIISVCTTIDSYSLPVFQIGVSDDNVIFAKVSHQNDIIFTWKRPKIDDIWDFILGNIEKKEPDIIINGTHNCMINCPECCDKPGYETKVKRKYCEYLIPVGNYCSYIYLRKTNKGLKSVENIGVMS
jgi:hypothetical protein